MAIQNFPAAWMTDEHRMLQESATRFFKEQWVPKDEAWREAGMMDREAWEQAGANGFLCASVPEQYGGAGGDFGHEAALLYAQGEAGIAGFGGSVHSGIVAQYILHCGTEEQKQRWLPRMASGELIAAIAMTEPGTGSDLQGLRTLAVREGDHYRLNGSKTFISNGQLANLVVVACKTDKEQGAQGISLLVVETDDAEGFRRGRNLEKIGMESQDTSELFFDDVTVSADNLLGGEEGLGFFQMMQELPQERLIVSIAGIATMELAMQVTLAYTKERKAFGKPIFAFQNTRFKLAECQALLLASRALVDAAMVAHLKGELGIDRAALTKYWVTDNQCKLVDECLQLFGGYGYMKEYPIARLWADSRVQRIYGGTNEIMKELASRFL
ncbi:acyl-CoA dehydrogenase [Rhodanobacter sp. Root561]|uniref:acyl-CoA dehydrogenase family protein n=1 Tax=Rhodanobacter sp. Root561 TaxID=1736560 RepID=UPI0007015C8C|nr:acyl-CoA dehydrogenase family protein [Rhodanobacter sp. Root561]KQZ79296.1 acyl-CoA dehydrogenase [Rhodanobacter sp. Root561]